MSESAISGIGNGIKNFNKYLAGIGSGDNKFDVKKLLFDMDGKVVHGNVPANTGSIHGYGYAGNSSSTASTGI